MSTCVCVLISLRCCVLMLWLVGAGSVNINYINESVISVAVMRRKRTLSNTHTHTYTHTHTHTDMQGQQGEGSVGKMFVVFSDKARLLGVRRCERTGRWLASDLSCVVVRRSRTNGYKRTTSIHTLHSFLQLTSQQASGSGMMSSQNQKKQKQKNPNTGCTSQPPRRSPQSSPRNPTSQTCRPWVSHTPSPILATFPISSPRLLHPCFCGVKPAI